MTDALLADKNKLHATERHNAAAKNVHAAAVHDNLLLLNEQQSRITAAVALAIPAIEELVTVATEKLKHGGRLFYIGAGTSGRLGVLDASEMPPTFGTDNRMIQGIIAGGDHALRNPDEIAEDSVPMGVADTAHLTTDDVLVGVSASGSAVYVRGSLQHARARGIFTAAICTAPDAPMLNDVDCKILAPTPAEIPAGSTRMFSGTAQKMVLNMISTCIMIGLGKVYGGYMIDVMTNNEKLTQRAVKMVETLTGCDEAQAIHMVTALKPLTKNPVKPAVVMFLENIPYDKAVIVLTQQGGRIDGVMRKHGRDKALGCD